MTNPAAVTMSIGLLADAQLSWFLHRHQDNYIVMRKLPSVYRDFAKTHTNPDTDGNFPYHRAVRLPIYRETPFGGNAMKDHRNDKI